MKAKKLWDKLFCHNDRIKNRNFFRRYLRSRRFIRLRRFARRLKGFTGPVLGALVGLIGGIPGVVIGILLGYLLGKLIAQSGQKKRVRGYFESPASQSFYEGEPGLAAWCALGVFLVSADTSPDISADPSRDSPFISSENKPEDIVRKVVLEASFAFSGPYADVFLMEDFSRLALSCIKTLNPDLLAESLAARRALQGDVKKLGRRLIGLAEKENTLILARRICRLLDPSFEDNAENRNSEPELLVPIPHDPWKILGLPPGTPIREVKAHYRRLAKQFHPDELQVLDEKQREAAGRAFMEIKEAYRQVAG